MNILALISTNVINLLSDVSISIGKRVCNFLTGDFFSEPEPHIAIWYHVLILLAFSGVLCVAIIWGLSKVSTKLSQKSLTKSLKKGFVIAWVFAFIVYDVGMYTGQPISLLTNAPMAIIHAFETFLLGSDVSAIHDPFHNSWVFMCFFSVSHVLSACISTLFIVKVFGFNLIQKHKFYKERKGDSKSETFVLWGINDATVSLVKSIQNGCENDGKEFRIIVVKTSCNTENTSESHIGINKILDIISLKDSELEQLRDLDCLIANSSDLSALSNSDANGCKGEWDIIRKELNQKSIAAILEEKTDNKIHFLLLSDDEDQNLHDLALFIKDRTLNNFLESVSDGINSRKVIFYCHARFNSVHRILEDKHGDKNMEVRVVDSSHINVELLKKNQDVLPVNFVDVEKDATVSSPFNAMVIGFSEVGQDAARFLYEFGAFVKKGADENKAVRSDFHLDIIDNRMVDIAGSFVANAPAIAPSISFVPELKNPDALIELHQEDCRSVGFYKMIEEKIKTLNYIVVATENDELNITTAVRIFKMAARYRDNLDKLCILIRVHNDNDGHFSGIVEYYNKLWASQDEGNIEGKITNEKFRRDDVSVLPLYIFSQDKDVYTYDNIIDESLVKDAKKFKENYEAAANTDYDIRKKPEMSRWEYDAEIMMQKKKEYHPAYACVMALRRKQGQDFANSLHRLTKKILCDKAMAKAQIPDFEWKDLERYAYHTDYNLRSGGEVDPRIISILTVLAQTEHLRWNASHEILGYVRNDVKGKDEVRLKHDCLTDWSNLSDETRSYDYNVVDLTLGIIDKDHPLKKKGAND